MPSPLFLLRHPANTLSPALFSPDELTSSVFAIRLSADSSSPLQSLPTIQSGDTSRFVIGQKVTYRELLELAIEAGKVITL